MIKLFQLPAEGWGIPSPSPFCMKVETWLRMAELPYESVPIADLSGAPKGKLPYIDDEGRVLGDSQLILEALAERYGDRVDAGLDARERTSAHFIRRTLEEGLYFAVVYFRWQHEASWESTRALFFRDTPALAEPYRKYFLETLQRQGTGRHSPDEVLHLARADLAALSHFLGDKPYLLGDKPRSLDAVGYGSLANILDVPISTPLADATRALPNLVEYCARMRTRFFG